MGSYASFDPNSNAANALRLHPSFKVPPYPEENTYSAIIGWTLEAAARLISPSPKLPEENEQFACEDVAKVVRRLKRTLMAEVMAHTTIPSVGV